MVRWITFLFLFLSVALHAQTSDEELAAQYMAAGEYDKAVALYEQLLDRTPASPYYYDNLLNGYIQLKQFSEAEKMVRKQARRFPNHYGFQVDQGYLLDMQEKPEKSAKIYEEVLHGLKRWDHEKIEDIAAAFNRRNLYAYAAETYLKARRLSGNNMDYALELAEIYGKMGDNEKMIEEFLSLIVTDFTQLENVQSTLQQLLTEPKDYEYLKKALIGKIQKEPSNQTYTEMLLWLLVQQRDFKTAYAQTVALDKRLHEGGQRVLRLADLCITNQEFAVAEQCYQYLISLGKASDHYILARQGLLNTRYQRLQQGEPVDAAQLGVILQDYKTFIDEFGRCPQTAACMRQLAHIYLLYANDTEKSIGLYEEIINLPQITPRFVGQCKLELGDAYLVSGDVWEPALLYGQVNKDFNEDPLGQEAKLRNARLAYYKGEFEWAQTQLDILKTATSQNISNDALELSLVIQDNTGLDSTEDALMQYAAADLLLFQNKLDACFAKLDNITVMYPGHTLTDDIWLTKARALRKKQDFAGAAVYYQKIIDVFGFDILADNALFELGALYQYQLVDLEKAKHYYEELITKHTDSVFAAEARKRYRMLRGDVLN